MKHHLLHFWKIPILLVEMKKSVQSICEGGKHDQAELGLLMLFVWFLTVWLTKLEGGAKLSFLQLHSEIKSLKWLKVKSNLTSTLCSVG